MIGEEKSHIFKLYLKENFGDLGNWVVEVLSKAASFFSS